MSLNCDRLLNYVWCLNNYNNTILVIISVPKNQTSKLAILAFD